MSRKHESAVGETETLLAEIWSELLGVDRVGRRDNFFELGGHSVLAMGVLSRLRQSLDVELTVSELFRRPELAAFAEAVDAAKHVGSPKIAVAPRGAESPLSAAQQRIWFMEQMSPGHGAYVLHWALRIKGRVVPAALEQALAEVQRDHDVLRAVFVQTEHGLVQRPQPYSSCGLKLRDLGKLEPEEREKELERLIREDARMAFDLEHGPPLRASLLKLGSLEWALLVAMHHIVSDGWSQQQFFRDLAAYYSALVNGVPPTVEPPRTQYADFVAWERQWLTGEECERQLKYWRKQLGGALRSQQLEPDHARPCTPTSRGAVDVRIMPSGVLSALHALGREEGVTLFMTLLAAFNVLLHRWNDENDIVVGTDVANRARGETANMIGLFVNQLVVRTDLSGHPTFREVVRRVKRVTRDAFDHQELPFDRLVDELSPARDPTANPLFQVMFILQTATAASVVLSGLDVTPIRVPTETAPFDLTVAFAEMKDASLRLECRYRTDLFEASTIERLIAQFEVLLASVTSQADRRIDEVEILAAAEASRDGERRTKRKASRVASLLSTKAKPVGASADELMVADADDRDRALPLVVRPRLEGVDLSRVARAERAWIDAHLGRHGAILFRGFGIDSPERLRAFTEALTSNVMDYGERSSPRTRLQQGVFTSTDHPADQPIVLHNEQSYTLNWPMKILFCCLIPAEVGGGTPLADSRRILTRLSEPTVRTFEEKGVMYVRNYGDGLGLDWREAFQTKDQKEVEAYCDRADIEFIWKPDGRLRTRQRRPAVQRHPTTGERLWFNHAFFFNVSSLDGVLRDSLLAGDARGDDLPFQTFFGDGSPISANVLDEIRAAIDAETTRFGWEPGDLLLVDNMLVAHGRERYEGPRRVIVSMAEPYQSVVGQRGKESALHARA